MRVFELPLRDWTDGSGRGSSAEPTERFRVELEHGEQRVLTIAHVCGVLESPVMRYLKQHEFVADTGFSTFDTPNGSFWWVRFRGDGFFGDIGGVPDGGCHDLTLRIQRADTGGRPHGWKVTSPLDEVFRYTASGDAYFPLDPLFPPGYP